MNRSSLALALVFTLAGCDDAKLGTFESEGDVGSSADDGDDNSDPDSGNDDDVMVTPGDCETLALNYDVITEGLRMTLIPMDGRMTFAIEIDEEVQPPPSVCTGVCDDHTYFYFEIPPEEQVENVRSGPVDGQGWDYRGMAEADSCGCGQGAPVGYEAEFLLIEIDSRRTCGIFYVDGAVHAFEGTREPFED